ncbi:uncharacterized protein K452DRAFT_395 [Aplosporella prunicola CBS 121167]|uniref:Uncharacterized protein n=1 Tax=Aplosporella prunicola CBS 121167 TaxID=1176127 RepID=A0A6A6BSF3_9PEZI|nr:uncharacterized protein K452DRAFT_395 [Aplosporella prunicola CBS 121167]KAF2147032.1 hypothetical protein K452DRAFT_395 [Aplosporella prunicola CBS 121167]
MLSRGVGKLSGAKQQHQPSTQTQTQTHSSRLTHICIAQSSNPVPNDAQIPRSQSNPPSTHPLPNTPASPPTAPETQHPTSVHTHLTRAHPPMHPFQHKPRTSRLPSHQAHQAHPAHQSHQPYPAQ